MERILKSYSEMNFLKSMLLLVVSLACSTTHAQMSKNGSRTVTAANTIVNEYTSLTANAAAGTTVLQVAGSALNANGRFTSNLSAGDLLMIIQIQGASLNGVASGTITVPNDQTWGAVTSYNNCGNHEFVQVRSVPNATSIEIDCGLQFDYTSSGKVQVIRVPRYSTLTVNAGASVTCDAWNGTTGGVVAIEAASVTVNGDISASGKGFRGGQLTGNDTFYNLANYATISTDGGGEKGESIFGYKTDYNALGGSIGRGAPANGGGGGNGWTNGGGGGANAGDINLWNGQGNPDNSVAGWVTAWNLESPGFSGNTSSGGGRGGYSWSSSNQNATTVAPGASAWGGDLRANHGGLGGRPLDYSTGKVFLGGGGGAGDQDNSYGGVGGAGGGLIFIHSYGTVSGSGIISSNGSNGANATGTPPNNSTFAGKDAAGGGGAGGTILLRAQGVSGVSVNANGGAGGNQQIVKGSFVFTVDEAEGPGGGGGGGYIALSAGSPSQSVSGGTNGITNSNGLSEFPPNGATKGGAGLSGQSLSNYQLTAVNGSACTGSSASLSVTITGNPPAGYTVNWYDSQTGGNVLGTGTTFNTPALTANTTYYAGICPGFYRIPVIATVVPGISVTVSPASSSLCSGSSVSLTASGGTTYTWSPSATLNTGTGNTVIASPASTTTYTVTGTTGSCTDTALAIVNVGGAASITATPASAIVCSGNSVTLNVNGALSYTWNPGTSLSSTSSATVVSNPSSTITYTVTGTFAGGCIDTVHIPVTVNPTPSVSVSPASNLICSGSSVLLTAGGATSYSWSPSAGLNASTGTTVTAAPASTTTYTVSGTTGGCSSFAISEVTVITTPAVFASPAISTLCEGASVTLSATGATTYSWTPGAGLSSTGAATVISTPTTTTTYTVTGTTSGCSDTAVVIVDVNPLPVVNVTSTATAVCPGNSATFTASGAQNYTWSPATGLSANSGSSVTATPASTITYTVTGTSSQGCTDTMQISLTVHPVPEISVSPASATLCSGNSVTLNATNGVTYNWSPSTGLSASAGSSVIAGPAVTTTYTVTGTQSSGCSDTAVAVVQVAASLTVSVNAASDTICAGSSTVLSASGAASYTWSPAGSLSSATAPSVIASPANTTTYTVIGTSGSCGDTSAVIITVNPQPAISLSVSDTMICEGSPVQFSAAGATSFTWTGPSLSSNTGAVITANPTVTSSYTLIGSNGSCSDTVAFEIDVDTVPVLTVTPAVVTLCSGQSTSLLASGASTYEWNPASGLSASVGASVTASPGVTTTYTVTGTNTICSATATAEVTVTAGLTASVSAAVSDICPGDTLTLTASGGASYNWEPSAGLDVTNGAIVNASPAATTTYTVIASSGSCSDTAEYIVKVNTVPVLSAVVSSDTICEGSTAVIDITGATSYTWEASASLNSTTSPSVTVNPAVTETFTVIGYNGSCSDTLVQSIVVEPNPVITVTTSNDSVCAGQSTTLSASGGTTYSWSPSGDLSSLTGAIVSATPVSSSTYTVTGTSGNCSAAAEISIHVTDIQLTSNIIAQTICEGDSVHVTVAGGDTYLISPLTGVTINGTGDYSLKPSTSTTYEVIGFKDGCSDTVLVNINVQAVPVITVSGTPGTICKGTSSSLTASGATSYTWFPSQYLDSDTLATVTASPDVTTTFTVYGSNGNCTVSDTVIINVTEVVVAVNATPSVICTGGSSTLTASGADSYFWFPSSDLSSSTGASVTATPSSTTTYTVGGTDINGCADTAFIAVEVQSAPIAAAGSDVTTCQQSASISATDPAPAAGVWSVISGVGTVNAPNSASSSIDGLTAGQTTLVWTVTNGCGSATDTLQITVTSGPSLSVNAAPSVICEGSSSLLTAVASGGTSPYTYSWSNGSTGSNQTVSPAFLTSYTVIAVDANGCSSNAEAVTVDVASAPIVNAGADVTIVKGESTTLTATGAASYSWSPDINLTSASTATTTASPMQTTVYTVLGTDLNGCTASDSVVVNVEEKTNIFIPDIFSPNGDLKNDILYVRGGNIQSFRFMVFDRWGEMVFETEDKSIGWDGTLRGRPMDEAVYVYILKGTYLDGSSFELFGNVTLIR